MSLSEKDKDVVLARMAGMGCNLDGARAVVLCVLQDDGTIEFYRAGCPISQLGILRTMERGILNGLGEWTENKED